MSVVLMKIPVCDVCGEAWLPKKGPAREDPAKHAGRCGKCKNPHWNSGPRDQRLRGRKIAPVHHKDGADGTAQLVEEILEEVPDLVRVERARAKGLAKVRPPRLCIHRVSDCPICPPDAR